MICECYGHQDFKMDYSYPWLGYGVCRICARADRRVLNLFSYESLKCNLVQKMETCLKIYVTELDNLPLSVCELCAARLACSYELMSDCLRGQQQFAEQKSFYYGQEMKMEESEVTDYRIISKVDYDDKNIEVKTYTELSPTKSIKSEDTVKEERHEKLVESCKCSKCDVLKYGGLPLLTEAIEQRERERESDTQYARDSEARRVPEARSSCSPCDTECNECYQTSHKTISAPHEVNDNRYKSASENYNGHPMHSSFRISEAGSRIVHDFNEYAELKSYPNNIDYNYNVTNLDSVHYKPKDDYRYESAYFREPVNYTSEQPLPLSCIKDENIPDLRDKTRSVKSKEKSLQCEFCDKLFGHMGDLNKHRRIHTNEKPYPCRICGKKFAHTSNLLRHERVHSGEKPFPCSVCGKVFGRKDKLISHTKSKLCKKRAKKLIIE